MPYVVTWPLNVVEHNGERRTVLRDHIQQLLTGAGPVQKKVVTS